MNLEWMAWTAPTAIFFAAIALILTAMTVWQILAPSIERRGLLPIFTTPGDRLFIGLLGSAYIHLAWVGLTDLSLWGASAIAVIWDGRGYALGVRRNGMRPVHPGEILREELDTLGLSANALSKALGVPVNRVTMIRNGQRGVTADTALRLARYFGTTPQLWLNLQKTWELQRAEIEAGREIAERVAPRQTAA